MSIPRTADDAPTSPPPDHILQFFAYAHLSAPSAVDAVDAVDAAHRCDAACDAELATLVRTATRESRRRVGGQGGGR